MTTLRSLQLILAACVHHRGLLDEPCFGMLMMAELVRYENPKIRRSSHYFFSLDASQRIALHGGVSQGERILKLVL